MSIASALGLSGKIRYGVVFLGDIAQEACLPFVAHSGNSEVTALVTQLRYFSDCILDDRNPESDGEEALADLRVIEGIREAIGTGRAVKLPPFTRTRRIDPDAQEQRLGAPHAPEPVNASSPAKEK